MSKFGVRCKMYVDGLNFRRIGRLLGVHHQSVVNWVNASPAALPQASEVPNTVQAVDTVDIIERDELFPFLGAKKTAAYVVTLVERQARRFVAWVVTYERSKTLFESLMDKAPVARSSFSAPFNAWQTPWYPGIYQAMHRSQVCERTRVRPSVWKQTTRNCATT